MKRLAVLFLSFISAPALADERRYTITDFDRIRIDGPYRVEVNAGSASTVTGTGARDALDRVAVDVEGRVLRIRTDKSSWKGSGNAGPVSLRITTRQLRGLILSGSGSAEVHGIKGLRFDLSLAGSGQAKIDNIAADRVVVTLTGAGGATLAGHAKLLEANLIGSSSLDAAALTAEDVKIASASAGNVTAAARRTATITGGGTGDIMVKGSAACTIRAEGAGAVSCGDAP
ncbi:head GIN domain-containing protein [Allosphingosinicella vermicomposti]|uniref:head GIN domain-containing protein n=1 Tax=Allosphingosinicella vermicomposti TaxID=614671 RepID=UPI000D1122A3|nr:head GIN domain-containing protein [Allosphingosinicella vermicomposti]